jgi:hypothetical protein
MIRRQDDHSFVLVAGRDPEAASDHVSGKQMVRH